MRKRALPDGPENGADRSTTGRPESNRPRRLYSDSGLPDRLFRGVLRGGGGVVLAVMLLVGGFLLYRGWPALHKAGFSFLTTAEWDPDAGHFGIAAVIVGTVLIAAVAVVVSIPLAIGTALYISEYAPARLRRTLVSVVDLMAAVPSVVYGLWGLFFLQGKVIGLARWLSTYFGWFPLFTVDGADPHDPLATATVYTASTFIAGLVVAMMVTPIIASIIREVFSQAPVSEREGAYALGATRWGMIQSVVLPYGKGGMIGGTMLGLGRALGETIGVYLVISPVFQIQPHILQSGTSSVSSLIALRYGEASKIGMSALMAAGLALFVLTLIVNFAASSIVARSRSGATAE
jgi:phosphate transport system permease protein